MGSGKTTVGTLLARQLAWRFVDLDDRIEESAGLPIPQIFERLGEAYFRQLEADQLRAVPTLPPPAWASLRSAHPTIFTAGARRGGGHIPAPH